MVFDSKFVCILSGNIQSVTSDGGVGYDHTYINGILVDRYCTLVLPSKLYCRVRLPFFCYLPLLFG